MSVQQSVQLSGYQHNPQQSAILQSVQLPGQQYNTQPSMIVQTITLPGNQHNTQQPAMVQPVQQPAYQYNTQQPAMGQPVQQPTYQNYNQQPAKVHPGPQVVAANRLEDVPGQTTCPQCCNCVCTKTEYKSGTFAWAICGGLSVVGCCFFAWIPFIVDSAKDVEHYCPNCNTVIYRYKRM
ncbi:unnamed protein product [Ophioblennius macclurei]